MAALPTLGSVANPRREGFDASIGDLLVRLASGPGRQLEIVTAPKQTARFQTEQTAEDYLPEFGEVFSRNDFSGGQGLDFAFRANLTELDRTRYWDSRGVDVSLDSPGEIEGVELLLDTELQTTWGSGSSMAMVRGGVDDQFLFVADTNTFINRITNPLGSPSVATEDPHTGTQPVVGLASLGAEVYAACGTDGIGKRSTAGSWSNLASAPTSVGIFSVKGRIISDDGAGTVSEIATTDGTATTLLTIRPNDRVVDVVDAGPVILVGTQGGTIYALREEGGSVTLVNQTRITPSDAVRTMAWSAGTLVVGTWDGTKGRIWSASIGTSDQDFSITGAQLLRELNHPPTAAAASRTAIYVGVKVSDAECELWRYSLRTTGISRHYTFATTAATAVDAITIFDGAVLAAISGGSNGVYRPSDTYVSEGYIISPMADFFSPTIKSWIDIVVQADNIGAGNVIDIYVATDAAALTSPDSGLWQLVSRVLVSDSIGERLILPDVRGRYAAVQMKLRPQSGGGDTPKLVSFALRAYADSEDFIVQLPVNVSDWIERHNRQPFRVKGWGERVYEALLGYDGTYVILDLFEPSLTFRGVIEEIGIPIQAHSPRGSRTTYSLVRFRGRLRSTGVTATPSGTLGVELLGVSKLGV